MRTTIDGAGRVVVPKAIRDEMGLTAGREIDLILADGRIEIELAAAPVHVTFVDGLPVLVPEHAMPPLSEEMVRDTLESVRR